MTKKILKWTGRFLLCLLIVFGLLAAYYRHVTVMVLNNLLQKQNTLQKEAWNKGNVYEKVPYAEVSASDYVDIYVPDDVENPPLLVMVHGGGFVAGDSQSRQSQLVYQYFREHGYAVASVNYRLAQEAAFPASVQDVKACVRFLRANAKTYGYNGEQITIMGESAGGYLAVMAAVTGNVDFNDLPYIGEDLTKEQVSAEVQGLVDYYGCVELGNMELDWEEENIPSIVLKIANYWASEELLGGYENFESRFVGQNMSQMEEEEKAKYMPAYYVRKNWDKNTNVQVYIFHGDSDLTVPILQSERFYDLLKEQIGEDRVIYHVPKKAGHAGEIMYAEKELSKVLEFMNSYTLSEE